MEQPLFDDIGLSRDIESQLMAGMESGTFIPEEEQEELVERLHSHYKKFESDISVYHQKLERWHELYEATTPENKEFPWEGASNFSVPLIRANIDSMQARIAKAVFDVDPLWLAAPRTSQGTELAKKVEAYLDYWSDTIDLPRKLDVAIQGMLIEGVGVLKVDWLREQMFVEGNEQPVITYDAPGVEYVPARDFVLIPADSPTIDDATYVGHRVFLTHQQLERRRDSDVYFNVDKLFEVSRGDRHKPKSANKTHIVTPSTGNVKYPETNQYELVEIYGPYDFGEGPEPAVMTFSPHHKILLRLERNPYVYGKAPYVDFCILPRPNFFWGFGYPEILESAQVELTALHNIRADSLSLAIAPPITRRHGSLWDPGTDPFGPGVVIDVTDHADVAQMQIAPVGNASFQHEHDIIGFVERLTGLSDYHMGRNANQNRTATEVNRVTSEGLIRLDTMVSRFQHGGMKKLGWTLWWLLYQFRPFLDFFYHDGQQYQITKTEKAPLDSGLMAFELQPHGILSDASKEARRQQLLMMFNTMAGVLSEHYPDGLQVLLHDILEEFGIKNAEQIIGPEWSIIQQQIQMAFQQGMEEGQRSGAQQVMAQLSGGQ